MDILSLLRTLGGLATVLGLLAGALWIVRRYDIQLPGRVSLARPTKRVAIVERVQLDQRRALVLVRRDDREHLFVLLPDRVAVLETGIAPPCDTARPAKSFREMVLCPGLDGGWYDE